MTVTKKFAYNFRLYPTSEQEVFLAKHFGCVRFIYNALLSYISNQYKKNGKSIGMYEAKRRIAILKRDSRYLFLKEVNSQSLQEAAISLGMAFKRFFVKMSGYPKFKKRVAKQSCTIPQHFRIKETKRGNFFLYIPKIKSGIRLIVHRELQGDMKRVVIKKTSAGNYYASIMCEDEIEVSQIMGGREIGIDVGLKHFLTTSYGEKIENPRLLKKYQHRQARLNRLLSRKKKGSGKREKARRKLAVLYEKISNSRKDFLHKLSRFLINENQVIRIESLHVKGLLKNQ